MRTSQLIALLDITSTTLIAVLHVVLKSALLWAAYLLMWQISAPSVDPPWPGLGCSDPSRLDRRVLAASALSAIAVDGDNSASCAESSGSLDKLVRLKPVCIVWKKPWAGDLGKSLLYQIRSLGPDRIVVGYFAYWSTERPWGDNSLTHWLLPAFAIDGFYSHLLFVLPGLQRFMYGPGDVEGVRVTYKLGGLQPLAPESIVADNESHREVALEVAEALDERGRILVYNDVWSHQLGGRHAAFTSRAGAVERCFSEGSLHPITQATITAFRLGSAEDPRRAGPAWGKGLAQN